MVRNPVLQQVLRDAKKRTELLPVCWTPLTDRRNRVTVDDEWIRGIRGRETQGGIIIGKW
jgi:hypothetical protein